jgi:hypothetical protein
MGWRRHLTTFGKRLDDDQHALVRSNVTIANEDKLQFYLEQMYDSNHFEKSKMLDWEKKPSVTKADYTAAKNYFKELVRATDTYAQNAGGGPPTQQVRVGKPHGGHWRRDPRIHHEPG